VNRFLIILVLVLGVFAVSAAGRTQPTKQTVTVHIVIANCFDSGKLSVPINRSYRRAGKGISGGGSGSCRYSYALHAVRLNRNRVRLFLSITTAGRSFDKTITLASGKPFDAELELGVRLIADF
jgi:hypothetical protein